MQLDNRLVTTGVRNFFVNSEHKDCGSTATPSAPPSADRYELRPLRTQPPVDTPRHEIRVVLHSFPLFGTTTAGGIYSPTSSRRPHNPISRIRDIEPIGTSMVTTSDECPAHQGARGQRQTTLRRCCLPDLGCTAFPTPQCLAVYVDSGRSYNFSDLSFGARSPRKETPHCAGVARARGRRNHRDWASL